MPLIKLYQNPLRGLWKMEETEEELLRLSTELQYATVDESLHTEKRRKEWLTTRLLLKELTDREYRIDYRPDGAPFLPDSPFSISISHTKGYATILLSEQPFAGTDIEFINSKILRIKERFLHPKELEAIDPENELNHLLIYWCAKEALFKLMGEQGVEFRDHLFISPFAYDTKGIIEAKETRTKENRMYQLEYLVTSDYVWVWNR